jgi:hypothetical protein
MDWFLMITTLLVNAGLGWSKGKRWVWIVHAINASLWIYYSFVIKQYGFAGLSVVTVIIDLISAWKTKNK